MIVALYRFLFSRLFFLLLLFSLCRLLFFLFYSNQFESCTNAQIAQAFLVGVRFDVSILLGFNVVFLLPLAIGRFFNIPKSIFFLTKILFVLVNSFLVALNLIDLEYFAFTGKRTGIEIIGIKDDVANQINQLILNYWHIGLLAFVLFLWILLRTLRLKYTPIISKKPIIYFTLGYVVFIGLSIIGIRSGFQLKPLRPNVAFSVEPSKLGNVVLNTPFNIFMTIGIEPIEEVHFFNSSEEVSSILNEWNTQTKSTLTPQTKKQNIVIIILESFGSEYWGINSPNKGFTPFLDSLAKTNLYFPNNFANGRASMEAVPSILASIPSLMQEPYITSLYQTNTMNGLGTILLKNGYHTSFFHAAKNGSMGFDAFTKNADFTHYYGLNEYTGSKEDYDGNWGIYDEPYLQYANNTISSFQQPFASCVFTISSHQPYSIPKKYSNKFPKGDLPVHETIGYVDYALKKFFEAARKEAWYDNTLFIITADHTHMHSVDADQSIRADYKVPLLFFHPKQKLQADTSLVSNHIDIMPSILDYLQIINPNPALLGQSVFGKQMGHDYAVNFANNTYGIFLKEYYIQASIGKEFIIKNYKDEFIRTANEKEKLFVEAIIQYYNNGMIHNTYFDWTKTK
ncbi:LTA synthase family protein [uncultured Cytophaga sp.]|uniref:LTA synthase family protein n=1 Tax=uncultured Cytophaga sp. TaxID=160238 RepID=UPI002619BFA4|nr:LTA synthase family protein [uncultured Cytophaga sp.]